MYGRLLNGRFCLVLTETALCHRRSDLVLKGSSDVDLFQLQLQQIVTARGSKKEAMWCMEKTLSDNDQASVILFKRQQPQSGFGGTCKFVIQVRGVAEVACLPNVCICNVGAWWGSR